MKVHAKSVQDRFAKFFDSKLKNILYEVRISDGVYNGKYW
jgi:hypothetical protein